ncbi:DNA mismatch repair protein MutT [Streptomyces nigrescens]|uniref:DNA mismatch repair protein MutT n=2 Tax=Streptomyces TaxID=1883 RepID=A0ABM7ZSG2_STRNI|nr:NUDIX domain-containing protein [Streptomyces nigrescens]MEE4418341.1 NUDIX domain-containing protein [Streptomyces sp. DSM 41528]BDM69309.1 DNA mismatch repair protein MutT [Streptomyces nigrescens]
MTSTVPQPPAPNIRTAAKAVILHEGRVLLMRARWRDQECYFLPGGGQHPGESFDDAVRREVHEETGLTVAVDRLLWLREYIGAHHGEPADGSESHRIEAIFLCVPTGDPHRLGGHSQDDTQTGLEWVPLRNLPSTPLLPQALRQPIADLSHTPPPPDAYLGDVA